MRRSGVSPVRSAKVHRERGSSRTARSREHGVGGFRACVSITDCSGGRTILTALIARTETIRAAWVDLWNGGNLSGAVARR